MGLVGAFALAPVVTNSNIDSSITEVSLSQDANAENVPSEYFTFIGYHLTHHTYWNGSRYVQRIGETCGTGGSRRCNPLSI